MAETTPPEENPPPPGSDPVHDLSGRHLKTLDAIFERPTRSDVQWRAIENLFTALGATIGQGRGSRVRVSLGTFTAVFHSPHPERVAAKGAVEAVRRFLTEAGVSP